MGGREEGGRAGVCGTSEGVGRRRGGVGVDEGGEVGEVAEVGEVGEVGVAGEVSVRVVK